MIEHAATVVIGRNEGDRLIRCLTTLCAQNVSPLIYVDSGSTDNSIAEAQKLGAHVVELDLTRAFTAARARNAGYARALEIDPETAFVQFVDGDCEVVDHWLYSGLEALQAEPDLAVVCGIQREKFPDATIWNKLMDGEWDRPSGKITASGGNALIRRGAFDQVGGFREDLIAGEEPEMCFRMRQKGWHMRRIDTEMAIHDAAMTKFSQWWQRAQRAGHTYAEGVAIHGNSPEKYRRRELRRTLIWGALIPFVALAAAVLLSPWALALLLAWPLQILRLLIKGKPWEQAVFLTLAKLPEAQGVFGYWYSNLMGRSRRLIEYK